MARSSVKLNSAGMEELLKSSDVESFLEGRGEAVLNAAQSAAPVASGEYRDSLRVWTEDHPTRVVVRVGSDAPHAWVVEANTGTLARALDAGR